MVANAVRRDRLALVVQRYGTDITGGAEAHARALAQRLAAQYDIDVYTTCARDARRWKPHYSTGESHDGLVRVLRFLQSPRGNFWQRRTPLYVTRAFRAAQATGATPFVPEATSQSEQREMNWLAAHGPYVPALVATLQREINVYRAVIAFSLRFWTAVAASRVAANKLLLVPTLHDEKAMYRALYRRPLADAAAVLFNSEAEQALATRLYGPCMKASLVVGSGVETAKPEPAQLAQVLAAQAITAPYFIYTGRICQAKGCDLLLNAFARFVRTADSPVHLILAGHVEMPLPAAPWLKAVGFVDEATRDALVASAVGLIQPSALESLSLSTLEAMSLEVPVIVNGRSEVLLAHVTESQGGYAFATESELQLLLGRALRLSESDRRAIGARGREYVQRKYGWDAVLAPLHHTINGLPAVESTT